ncbi:hypothetical protein BDD43_0480 [Mucilaginibacter gracilis]|uniref:Uncharacterized protein n=1 Tax=Mucilaginibacter gracilis TaxID=423350 RepID=A0A495IWZ4_9SPHI|nr:hypothetical protein [Mucilaginibacter gracilis]RKR80379.1 hypothetical protein BDD43_0480 [Mucilaginibacter gracilis]
MKADFKAIILCQPGYIDLSERLRGELETKIDELYAQNRFNDYVNKPTVLVENATKSDLLYAYLLRQAPRDFVLSGKLLEGIKTWFNMYYDDRHSVIDKFRTCYQNVMPPGEMIAKKVVSIVFCKFLINELLSTLAENRYRNLVHQATGYRQMLSN